jgi:hypothetical protein
LRKNSQELDRNWKNKNNSEKNGNCQSKNKEKTCHLKDSANFVGSLGSLDLALLIALFRAEVVPYDNVEMGVDTKPSTEDAHVDCNGITGDSSSLFFPCCLCENEEIGMD